MHKHDEQWPMFRRVLQQAQRLDDVMARLGIEPCLAARQEMGAAFARARTTCLFCPFMEDCERWLARAGAGAAEPPGFCPNAAFFAACRSRSGSRRSTRPSR